MCTLNHKKVPVTVLITNSVQNLLYMYIANNIILYGNNVGQKIDQKLDRYKVEL